MKVTNRCSFEVAAVVKHAQLGQGEIVKIKPGESGEVYGPRVHTFPDDDQRSKQPGVGCILLEGEVTVHEGPDDDANWQLAQGEPLNLGEEGAFLKLIVSHSDDVVEE